MVVVTWSSSTPETVDSRTVELLAAVRPPGATSFGAPELISSPGMGVAEADVAHDPRTGRPAIVWSSISATSQILFATREG